MDEELIAVKMGLSDWEQVIVACRENHDDLIADSIQDVLDSNPVVRKGWTG